MGKGNRFLKRELQARIYNISNRENCGEYTMYRDRQGKSLSAPIKETAYLQNLAERKRKRQENTAIGVNCTTLCKGIFRRKKRKYPKKGEKKIQTDLLVFSRDVQIKKKGGLHQPDKGGMGV